jgi:hypothetical protein
MNIAKAQFKQLGINHISSYTLKSEFNHGKSLLKNILDDLLRKIVLEKECRVKVFVDGTENAFFRKIYEPVIRKRFPGASLRFANSMKKPMIQVADFYAGYRRRIKRR